MRSHITSSLRLLAVLATHVATQGQLSGYPYNPFAPYCAMACIRPLMAMMLDCSSDGQMIGSMLMTTTTECWADNTPYLSSLAWCMNIKCAPFDIPASELEHFWETQATGQQNAGAITVPPKWSYGEALALNERPMFQLTVGDMDLNRTALIPNELWIKQYNIFSTLQRESTIENTYGISMLSVGFGLPIVITILGYLPPFGKIIRKVRPYLVWPSTIGTYQVRPLPYLLGNAPTIGQTLYIVMFAILNIIFTCIGYRSGQPSAWYKNTYYEIFSYIMYRTGIFGYILAPLVFLFGGRNNVLLWATNWSHSTYLLLHRWVARVFAFQSLLHSVLAVILYKMEGRYHEDSKLPYWSWGIVATVAVVVLIVFSHLPMRNWSYEIFLIVHIVFSVIMLVGFWYHAYLLYAYLGGLTTWIHCCVGVWVFDRMMRVLRILRAGGIKRASITEMGALGEYVRIDIPGIRYGVEPGQHIYVYFPTLHPLKPWENHPFSVLQTALLDFPSASATPDRHGSQDIEVGSSSSKTDEKVYVGEEAKDSNQRRRPAPGLTLYVRKSTGATKYLSAKTNIIALVEGPYSNNNVKGVLRCDRILLIGGGIGITALLPFVNNHWNVKLAWSVRNGAACLINELEPVLNGVADKIVVVGARLQLDDLLAQEANAGWQKVGVVISGPGSLCDDARAAVIKAAKLGTTEFEMEVEAYSW
ncbi:hypothetical protein H072_340 [Dactylellina haptotyla CBS 200.50]|uniref:FAD-binding FR-type domain-containing protein n=1 Tax=Dactylellina haptotyla (strain CBS 200.50) TaxID=1284197 RepID=S8C1P0_DACHA|nr:hypothetical protein H072_340 [Dactylellina haptotyla CBS 200.50]